MLKSIVSKMLNHSFKTSGSNEISLENFENSAAVADGWKKFPALLLGFVIQVSAFGTV